jgi:aldose 1-epimerase
MSGYIAERAHARHEPLVVLRDEAGRRVRVACHGAALVGLEAPRRSSVRHRCGSWDAAAIRARAGSRFAVRAPLVGRAGDARYCFDHREDDSRPEPGV